MLSPLIFVPFLSISLRKCSSHEESLKINIKKFRLSSHFPSLPIWKRSRLSHNIILFYFLCREKRRRGNQKRKGGRGENPNSINMHTYKHEKVQSSLTRSSMWEILTYWNIQRSMAIQPETSYWSPCTSIHPPIPICGELFDPIYNI